MGLVLYGGGQGNRRVGCIDAMLSAQQLSVNPYSLIHFFKIFFLVSLNASPIKKQIREATDIYRDTSRLTCRGESPPATFRTVRGVRCRHRREISSIY